MIVHRAENTALLLGVSRLGWSWLLNWHTGIDRFGSSSSLRQSIIGTRCIIYAISELRFISGFRLGILHNSVV